MPLDSAENLKKMWNAANLGRMAATSEEKQNQLAEQMKLYENQYNLLSRVQAEAGGAVLPKLGAVDPRYATPEGGYGATKLSAQGKLVEQKKQRYFELQNQGQLTEEEQAEMQQLGQWLSQ